jgi:hypothetical protein
MPAFAITLNYGSEMRSCESKELSFLELNGETLN